MSDKKSMMFSWQRSWGLWPQQKLIRLTTAVALMGGARKRPEILQPGSYSQRAGAGSYSRHANSEFQSGSYSQRAGAGSYSWHTNAEFQSGSYSQSKPGRNWAATTDLHTCPIHCKALTTAVTASLAPTHKTPISGLPPSMHGKHSVALGRTCDKIRVDLNIVVAYCWPDSYSR